MDGEGRGGLLLTPTNRFLVSASLTTAARSTGGSVVSRYLCSSGFVSEGVDGQLVELAEPTRYQPLELARQLLLRKVDV